MRINPNYSASSTLKELIIVHELGHTIRFRHTNAYVAEDIGLGWTSFLIEGTKPATSTVSTGPDQLSVMNSGPYQATQTWRGFSYSDIIAARNLYPLDNTLRPFYKYRNDVLVRHHFTTNWSELGAGGVNNWIYEGRSAGFIYNYNITGSIPLYRYYNSGSSDHFFTVSATTPPGYVSEGIAGYVFSTQVTGSMPLYRYYKAANGHYYTPYYSELGSGSSGWTYEGIECYVMQ